MTTVHINDTQDTEQPKSPHRRSWLKGIGVGAVSLGAGALATKAYIDSSDGTQTKQDAYGTHQAGIITPQPAAAIIVVFDVLAKDKKGFEKLLRTLTDRITFLTQGGQLPQIDPKFPPLNSGIMGDKVFPDNLTMTVSLGASVFDGRFGLTDLKPQYLQDMQPFPNDALEPESTDGDLSIQICSNTAETCIHALRDIIKNTPDLMTMRWQMNGFLPPHMIRKLGKDTMRNLLGFKDGTSNVDAKNDALLNELIWVSDHANSAGEPAWAKGGSYQVVRLIRNRVEFWDRTPLQEQETIFGRHKLSGAPLGKPNEHDDPDFASDPDGKRIPHDAHIRLANPRTPETRKNLILRRGYNYSQGLSKSGQLNMGLLFVCYQSNLLNGFLTVQGRMNGESLEEYIKPFGGGYFFSLPGFAKGEYLGQGLIQAAV
ncbi:Deferrochelatase/peroxidase EfeB [Ephemeroptericola cinctiostellae]|uniref:Deferrochelatase n=1 Tax=Ephemeroptericola cinctiostellae TaxID=2268024 RepID=A0A345DCR5_9BURK|nr:iron uptake transporter deferrochelatase/peroxidase subunit [Ephemeroptericola cinctiostellae]AXF86153.1 Deferrochelatase/peroxidase EfeB [Ephemeroptericola cinctiostellae]